MTNMIYRGVKHDGQRSAKVVKAQDLIYRGVAHDGMSEAPAARCEGTVMCYRGVRYQVQANGAIAWIDPQTSTKGAALAAMQAA